MTFLEATNTIEKRVAKLQMKYHDGELMEPIVALGRIGSYHGERFDNVLEALKTGAINTTEYFMEMIKMIMEYEARPRN